MSLLQQQVEQRGVEVLHSASAVALTTRAGAVTGVEAVRMGAGSVRCRVRARRGVVLATGGFEFDEWMKLNYLKAYPTHFLGSPANTGDGIRMATAVGAQLWHMNCCSARLVIKFPELPVALNPVFGGAQWHSPWRAAVSGPGKRAEVSGSGGGRIRPAPATWWSTEAAGGIRMRSSSPIRSITN